MAKHLYFPIFNTVIDQDQQHLQELLERRRLQGPQQPQQVELNSESTLYEVKTKIREMIADAFPDPDAASGVEAIIFEDLFDDLLNLGPGQDFVTPERIRTDFLDRIISDLCTNSLYCPLLIFRF